MMSNVSPDAYTRNRMCGCARRKCQGMKNESIWMSSIFCLSVTKDSLKFNLQRAKKLPHREAFFPFDFLFL